MPLPPYVLLDKAVGQTPLSCLDTYRTNHPELTHIPLAYAGRLDPMASGKLLVLIGDTCKQQTIFHDLDKAYDFSVLFGIGSDTYDVLGRLTIDPSPPDISVAITNSVLSQFRGNVTLPYPHFSSKTVSGKPLHTWTLENRLSEIVIPTKTSTVYVLTTTNVITMTREHLVTQALEKIATIPTVTDPKKALGNDFRRSDIIPDWNQVRISKDLPRQYHIVTFRCVATSGTYMRTLAHRIAHALGTHGLAWHIHRTNIGRYNCTDDTWHMPNVDTEHHL